jgi:hypothetical protein
LEEKKDISVPLSSGFMATSIIGFFVSIWFVMDYSEPWGFTFMVFFIMLFIASIVSMTRALPIPEHMDELAIHRQKEVHEKKKKRKIE